MEVRRNEHYLFLSDTAVSKSQPAQRNIFWYRGKFLIFTLKKKFLNLQLQVSVLIESVLLINGCRFLSGPIMKRISFFFFFLQMQCVFVRRCDVIK